MSIQADVADHPFLLELQREAIDRGLALGVQQGIERGIEQGMTRREKDLLLRQLGAKFGTVPNWAKQRLDSANHADIDRWACSLLTAADLESALE